MLVVVRLALGIVALVLGMGAMLMSIVEDNQRIR